MTLNNSERKEENVMRKRTKYLWTSLSLLLIASFLVWNNSKTSAASPETSNNYRQVTANQENLRDLPNGKKLGVLLKDTRVETLEKQGNWVKVQVTGWMWAPSLGLRKVQQQKRAITVYITRTGKKYHRSGCRYLSRSCIPISKKDALANGYTPCKVCKP